jgi:hypothetical protein
VRTAPGPSEETREERIKRFEKYEGRAGLLFLIIVAVLGARPFVNWVADKLNNLDDHPLLAIYLLGCALVPALALVSVFTFWVLAWLTKTNVLTKNLKKLQASTTRAPFPSRAVKFLATWLFEIALSWISVALLVWRLLKILLGTAREVLSSRPESIKLLSYPLKNDPHLPVESVWAYAYALTIRGGSPPPDEAALTAELEEISAQKPRFDRAVALRQLESLDVVKPAVIAAVAARRRGASAEEEDEPNGS